MANILIFNDAALSAWARSGGPYRIATELRKHGYTVQVVEHFLWASILSPEKIFSAIDQFVDSNTLYVGFSITFFQQTILRNEIDVLRSQGVGLPTDKVVMATGPYTIPLKDSYLFELREAVLRRNPKTKLVIGGASKNKLPLEGTPFDVQILGFADNTSVQYAKYLEGKNPFFQRNGKYIDHDQRATGFDVDNAVVRWTERDLVQPEERLPIELSRGCIFKCKFCGYSLNGKKKLDYTKSAQVLKEELERNYEQFGTTDYWFSDDTFNDTVSKVEAVCDVITNLSFKITFRAYLRLDLLFAHQHTIDMMQKAGLNHAMFGIESLNYDNAKLIGKGLRPEVILQNLETLWTKHNWKDEVFVLTCLLVGLPFDSKTNLQWLDTVVSPEFRSDFLNINPLYLTAVPSELNASEFDKNFADYGYRFDTQWHWTNTKTGFTFTDAQRYVKETMFRARYHNQVGLLQEHYKRRTKGEVYDLARSIYNFDEPQTRNQTRLWLHRDRVRLMNDYFAKLQNLDG